VPVLEGAGPGMERKKGRTVLQVRFHFEHGIGPWHWHLGAGDGYHEEPMDLEDGESDCIDGIHRRRHERHCCWFPRLSRRTALSLQIISH
jgi:hypothetical protein